MILSDELRAGTQAMLHELRALGIERIVLATGDRHEVAEAVAAGLSIDLVRSELTPDQKILVVLSERKNGPVMMIGDGVNDAPALAAADIGLAMGAKGPTGSRNVAFARNGERHRWKRSSISWKVPTGGRLGSQLWSISGDQLAYTTVSNGGMSKWKFWIATGA